MKPVVIYTAVPCPYCASAKELLRRRSVPYEEIRMDWDDQEAWAAASVRSGGMKTVPQIFIDGRCIGGFRELSALDQSGELARLLA